MAVFLAPDDPASAEGVAGQAWRRLEFRVGGGQHPLPDLNNAPYLSMWTRLFLRIARRMGKTNDWIEKKLEVEEKVRDYAVATSTSANYVWSRMKKRKACPTFILGMQILDSGHPWGVVVIDSCNHHECIDSNDEAFREGFTKLLNDLDRYDVKE